MRIECTLPNASNVISGIAFARTDSGTMVSTKSVDVDEAARLLSIDGFRPYGKSDDSASDGAAHAVGDDPAPAVKRGRKAATHAPS